MPRTATPKPALKSSRIHGLYSRSRSSYFLRPIVSRQVFFAVSIALISNGISSGFGFGAQRIVRAREAGANDALIGGDDGTPLAAGLFGRRVGFATAWRCSWCSK